MLAEGVADRIIGLYALGNSIRQISDWMEENLGNRVSVETISAITDCVLPEIKVLVSRPWIAFIQSFGWMPFITRLWMIRVVQSHWRFTMFWV